MNFIKKNIALFILSTSILFVLISGIITPADNQIQNFSFTIASNNKLLIYNFILFVFSVLIGTFLLRKFTLNNEHLLITNIQFKPYLIYALILIIFVFYFYHRIWIKDYWISLRIDKEQEQWPLMAKYIWNTGVLKAENLIWSGWYNAPYALLLAPIHGLLKIDTWFKYQMVNISLFGFAHLVGFITLYKNIRHQSAALFYIIFALFSSYSIYASFYLKHHYIMIHFYLILLFLSVYYWNKPNLLRAILISLCLFLSFMFYLGTIYYLPIAVAAILLSNIEKKRIKLSHLLIAITPTVLYLLYLFLNPTEWPSDYVLRKSVLRTQDTLNIFLYNLSLQYKLALVPLGIWNKLILIFFHAGVIFILASRKPFEILVLFSYIVCMAAKTSTWDQELGHHFITFAPYVLIAAIGAGNLLDLFFKQYPKINRNFKFVFLFICSLFIFINDSNWIAKSEHWQNLNVPGYLQELNRRVWYFDDAKALQKNNPIFHPTYVSANLLKYKLGTEFNFITQTFKELHPLVNLKILPINTSSSHECIYLFLTDTPRQETSSSTQNLLSKYRPSNPRYQYYNYQPEVYHYLYEIRNANCSK